MIKHKSNLKHHMMKKKTGLQGFLGYQVQGIVKEHKESSKPLGNTPKEPKGNLRIVWKGASIQNRPKKCTLQVENKKLSNLKRKSRT